MVLGLVRSCSEATTTKETDAITPSNFVIWTEEFAATNGLSLGYGIPSGGYITGTFYYVIQLSQQDKPVTGWLMLIG